MKKNLPLICVFVLLGALWAYSLFGVPTFDLDESLYRRVAEEMKVHQTPWNPTWDAWPLYHKPPFFYWMMIFFSRLFDDANDLVSTAAARMPSLLANVGILVTLFFSRDYLFGAANEDSSLNSHRESSFNVSAERSLKNNLSSRWIAPLLYLSGLFPLLTSTAVILDPLQTFLLLPSLLIPTRYFLREQWKKNSRLSFLEIFFWSLSLFVSTVFKGLNGIVIPTFAFGVQLLLLWWAQRKEIGIFSIVLRESLRFLFYVFIPAAILCVAGFYYLDLKMGRDFTSQFFLVHHLGRSEEAMETHGGSIFYHPLVLFVGGGFLSSFFIFQLLAWWNRFRKPSATPAPSFIQYGFPLTFIFSFVFAFSFVATKLPHYTWPIWPALAIAGLIHFTLVEKKQIELDLSRGQKFVASLPVTLLGIIFLFCSLNVLNLFSENRFELIAQTEGARTMLSEFPGFHGVAQIYLFIGLAICFLFQRYRMEIFRHPAWLALAGLITTTALSFSIMPIVISLMVDPPTQIGTYLREKYVVGGECIRFAAPHSPTLSLAIGFKAYHNRCEPEDAEYLIVPSWKQHECEERKFTMLEKSGYLYLCGKLPLRTTPRPLTTSPAR